MPGGGRSPEANTGRSLSYRKFMFSPLTGSGGGASILRSLLFFFFPAHSLLLDRYQWIDYLQMSGFIHEKMGIVFVILVL